MIFHRISTRAVFLILCIVVGLSLCPPFARAEDAGKVTDEGQQKLQAEDLPVEVVADSLQYQKEESKIVAQGNVLLTYKKMKLQSDYAEVYTATKQATAQGHVTVFEGDSTISGEKTEYNFDSYKGTFPKGTIYQTPWYGFGEKIDQVSKDQINAKETSFTTCNFDRPHYDLYAKSVTVYPDDKIILKNVYFRILGRKCFWLPYMQIPIDKNNAWFEVQTGYSDNFGFYFQAAKEFSLSKNVKLKGHADFRSKRGMGYGLDLMYNDPEFGRGKVITYLAPDKRAPKQLGDEIVGERVKETRYRVTVRHRTDFNPDTNVFVNWNELSDEFILQEFFEREYHAARPRSQVVVNHVKKDYQIYAEAAKRAVKAYSDIERLPRAHFSWRDQPLFDTDMLYKHEMEFSNFKKVMPRAGSAESDVRVYTDHTVKYPFRILDQRVKITPFANIQGAYYSKGTGCKTNMSRFFLAEGVEARTRFQKAFEATGSFMGIQVNKLRHIAEPIFRYQGNDVCTESPDHFYQMDNIDKTHRGHMLQFALDNILQTKRHPWKDKNKAEWKRVDLVSYSTWLNYEMNDFRGVGTGSSEDVGFKNDRGGGGSLTDFGHKMSFRPYDWLTFQGRFTFDFTRQDFKEFFYDAVLNPENSDWFRLMLSHGYYGQDPQYGDNSATNVMLADVTLKINKRWKVGGFARAEFETGKLEEWEIRFIRDLHDFILTFGANVRNSRFTSGSHDKTFFVSLNMVAFPDVGLNVGNRSSLPEPRIGANYDGSLEEEQLGTLNRGAY